MGLDIHYAADPRINQRLFDEMHTSVGNQLFLEFYSPLLQALQHDEPKT
jgi:hypothetical protein